jgi:GTP-binding protein EngB required for normal cell division
MSEFTNNNKFKYTTNGKSNNNDEKDGIFTTNTHSSKVKNGISFDKKVSIAILGNKMVGKSAFIRHIVEGKFQCSYKETFLINFYDCKLDFMKFFI